MKFKSSQTKKRLKDKFDPLNIVNRMTGGSKLATVLAGKLMGRKESSIRSAAGLQPIESAAPSFMPDTTPEPAMGPSREMGGEATPLLEQMVKGLAFIATRVNDIAVKMKAGKDIITDKEGRLRDKNTGRFVAENELKQTDLLEELVKFATKEEKSRDEEKDAATESQYEKRFGKTPTSPSKLSETAGKDKTPGTGGWFDWVWGLLKEKGIAFLSAIGGALLGAGTKVAGLLFDALGGVKTKIVQFIEKAWEALKGTGDVIKKGAGWVAEKGGGLLRSAGKLLGFKGAAAAAGTAAAATAAVKAATKAPEAPKAEAPKAETKVAPKAETKVAPKATPAPKPGAPTRVPKESTRQILRRLGPKMIGKTMAKSLPFVGGLIGLGSAAYSLSQGDLTQAALDAGMGVSSLTGIGSVPAFVGGLVGTLVNQAYKEKYQIDPLSDPDRVTHMAELTKETQDYVMGELIPSIKGAPEQVAAENNPPVVDVTPTSTGAPGRNAILAAKAPTEVPTPAPTAPSAPTEVPMPAPTTGMALQQAADLRAASAGQAGTAAPVVSAPITAVKTNNINSTMIHQNIASARSQESSYLRTLDRNYATP